MFLNSASHLSPSRIFVERFGLRERLRERLRDRDRLPPPRTLIRFNSTRFSESPSSNSISQVSSERTRVTLPLYHLPRPLKSASTRSPSRGFFERFGLRSRRFFRALPSESEPASRDLTCLALRFLSVSPSSYLCGNQPVS